MKYSYTPKGVCAYQIDVDIDDGKVKEVLFHGGCEGNAIGIQNLVVGMEIDEVIKRLSGVDCDGKGTSCPDQLTLALKEALEKAR